MVILGYNTDCSSVLNIENDVLKELKLYTRNKKSTF
jgi:hypothetical protein